MQMFGRALQVFGLILVPMALVYYFAEQGKVDESKLMFGELMILAGGATSFWVGKMMLDRAA